MADFLDPITKKTMSDPVIAKDGYTYDRASIEEWFKEHGAVSPKLQVDIPDMSLTPDESIIAAMKAIAKAVAEGMTPEVAAAAAAVEWQNPRDRNNGRFLRLDPETKVLMSAAVSLDPLQDDMSRKMSEVFKELDPMRDLLDKVLGSFKPPRIVVLGDESSGKSTVLEQLSMMPVFPRNDIFCTKMPIYLRLRRSPDRATAIFTVRKKKDGTMDESDDGIDEGPITFCIENSFELVQTAMQACAQAGVSTDKVIVLEIHHKNVPTIDLVDLPGMTIDEDDNRSADVEKIIHEQLAEDAEGGHSFYVAVVPTTDRQNASLALQFVKENLSDKCIGVHTKVDEMRMKPDVLRSVLTGEPSPDGRTAKAYGHIALPLPGGESGWFGTMLKPPDEDLYTFERLYEQRKREIAFFKHHESDTIRQMYEEGKLGCGALVNCLVKQYFDYLNSTWKESALKRVTVELEEKKLELASTGVREPSKQEEMAKAEVARRLGPGSHVLKLREVYLKTAVHKELRDGLTKYLTDAFHQKGGTLKVDANDLQETLSHHKDVLKAKLPELLMAGSFEGYWEGELEAILKAKNTLESSPLDGLAKSFSMVTSAVTSSLSGWMRKSFEKVSRRDALKKLEEEPIVDLSSFPQFTEAIIVKCRKLFKAAEADLLWSLGSMIDELFDVTRSRFLSFKSVQDCAEIEIRCSIPQFVEKMIAVLVVLMPTPKMLETIHTGVSVGQEEEAVKEKRAKLDEEIKKIERARDGIVKALNVSADDLAKIEEKLAQESAVAAAQDSDSDSE